MLVGAKDLCDAASKKNARRTNTLINAEVSLEFALRTLVRMRTFPVKQFAFGPHFTQQFAFRPGELHADDRGCNKDFIYRCRASRLPCRFCRSSPKQRSPRLYKYLLILQAFSTIWPFFRAMLIIRNLDFDTRNQGIRRWFSSWGGAMVGALTQKPLVPY